MTETFYNRSALEVAPELLGKILVRKRGSVVTSGRIVEVEAYMGSEDPASHAYRGKTRRNAVMFGPAGRAYVYFTYGNHYCINVVTGEDGVGSAVLIRALEPIEGMSVMKRRRRTSDVKNLASGPGKLTQALGIELSFNGATLFGDKIRIERDSKSPEEWIQTERIGISSGNEFPYRFLVKGSAFVSKGRIGPAKSRKRRA